VKWVIPDRKATGEAVSDALEQSFEKGQA